MTSRTFGSVGIRNEPAPAKPASRLSALLALYSGLTMTLIVTAAPYLDQATKHTLANHIRVGYPHYTQAHINAAVSTYEGLLTVMGVLGVVGWAIVIRALRRDNRWTASMATVLFVLGLGIALTDLLVKDTSGDSGLSPLLGWVGLLPCLPGVVAVRLLWRKS